MPAYKDKAKGTWYASFYYEDWTGKKVKKMKRGFPTKREALEWERTFLQQQTADLEMTFENFVADYISAAQGLERNEVLLLQPFQLGQRLALEPGAEPLGQFFEGADPFAGVDGIADAVDAAV